MMESIKYTCNKCQVEFTTRELVNAHYSGKWHQYNLIRILKDLQGCSEKEYNELMAKTTYLHEAKNCVNTINCRVCKKSFTSQGSFDTHQRSRKHRDNIIRKRAEIIRRQKIQLKKFATEASSSNATAAIQEMETETGAKKMDECQYCTACKAAFQCEKDYLKHAKTLKHMRSLKAFELAAERKQELDRQDAEHATNNQLALVSADVDADDWDDASSDGETMSQGDDSKDDTKLIPINCCLFCNKRSANLSDNLGHMERQHSFIVPHRAAGKMEDLFSYIGEKVGEFHQCLQCSKEFRTLRACQLHMLDKPHMAIRFEGEYDQFFIIDKIMARIQLPAKPAENDVFAFPMPDGTMLTHRDLRRYFNQRLSMQPTAYGLKRLTGGNLHTKAITHLGKASENKSLAQIRSENKRTVRALQVMHKKQDKKQVDVSVKANKLQKHFRLQVINAG